MKNLSLLLLLVLTFAFQSLAIGQNPIPNPSFETWEDTAGWGGSLPDGWLGFANDGLVTQSTDAHSGSYALGGAVIPVPGASGDTTNGTFLWYAANNDAQDGFGINFPPVAFEGYYKLTSVGNDALEIDVFYSKQGYLLSASIFVDSTSGSGYRFFSIPPDIPLSDIPDTVTMYIMLNNSSGLTHMGTSFVLDDIAVTGSSSVSTVQNPGLPLEQNFPNPFGTNTTIQYSLPTADKVSLVVFNILGERMAVLENGVETAGRHEVHLERGNLPAGIYSYQLSTASGLNATRFLQIVK